MFLRMKNYGNTKFKINMKQKDVCYVNLDPTVGREINKTRPCVVVSPDEMNNHLGTVIIVPITSKERRIPTRIYVDKKGTGLTQRNNWALLDQIKTVDKIRLAPRIGVISQDTWEQISAKLREMFE